MTELPELPPPKELYLPTHVQQYYDPADIQDVMREYGRLCAQAEREDLAVAWEHANGFDKYGVAQFIRGAAIRAG